MVADVLGQSSAKPVQQPPEVVEAYRMCNEFQRLLADDLDFDRAFEATFTKDPAKRRAIAIAEGEFGDVDISNVDDATLLGIYKTQAQFIILLVPMVPASGDNKPIVFPPKIEEMFKRPKQPQTLQTYLAQLKQDLAVFRAHFDKLAASNDLVAEKIRDLKKGLKETVTPPNHVVKPLTAYSHGHVLPLDAEYYQIGNYSVIREAGQMKLIRFRLFDISW
jgi:hypothetical protein